MAVPGSIFLALMYGRVVDGYFAFHGGSAVVVEAEHAQAVIELEDWSARITNDQWRAFLDRLPDTTGNAYESVVVNSYLSAFQDTLAIILGVIVVMIVASFGFVRNKSPYRNSGKP